ncbi:MAG: long-chain fatty acid--CoA ligase [Rhodospirillales bacterium]|nr:long-chain fatty acid--CoA ligase [Rhodospirillales bacterium]MCB9997305.1 long-chain fatty acid--CoA ligase [Rhodospirillales bacterium]
MTKSDKAKDHHYQWLASYPADVSWDQEIPVCPVYDILDQTCRTFAAAPAFDFLDKKWNWGQVGDLVNRMAKGLQNEGVGKGTKVGLFLPNSPYFLISYYAVMKAGGTVVNFNPLYAPRELQHQIEDSETDFMITLDLKMLYDKMHEMLHDTRLKKLVICSFTDILPFPKNILFRLAKGKELARLMHPERYVLFKDLINNNGKPDPVEIDPVNDIAVLQYTGGTTGVPKGAMLTHANVVANVEQAVLWFHKAEKGKEKMMGVLPFFHVFAMTAVMNMAVRCAFEIIALPRFDLDQALKVIAKKKPHYFPAVPAIYNAINNHPKLDSFDLKSLKYCISGGAPLPVEVKKAFEKNTGCVVVEGYGLTETSPVVCANPIEGENKPGSIGQPMPGTIVTLLDPEDGKTPVAMGEPGELCVRGPQVMKGYYNRPDDTADTITDGFLHTGDIAHMDKEGYFFIVDRIKDLIITNGYNVYPRHVEEAIYLHPNVEECIVAGLPDKARGEIVKAWIKPRQGRELTAEDIRIFLKDKISKIEIPRQIEIRSEPLPKTMIGKLSRKDILAEEQQKEK